MTSAQFDPEAWVERLAQLLSPLAQARESFLHEYQERYGRVIDLRDGGPPPSVPECRDPLDRPFLELAIAGRADALVTGDADLLALADSFAVPILAPAALREWLPVTGGAPADDAVDRPPLGDFAWRNFVMISSGLQGIRHMTDNGRLPVSILPWYVVGYRHVPATPCGGEDTRPPTYRAHGAFISAGHRM